MNIISWMIEGESEVNTVELPDGAVVISLLVSLRGKLPQLSSCFDVFSGESQLYWGDMLTQECVYTLRLNNVFEMGRKQTWKL